MATPHIEALKEDIAPLVLMPGDPLRAKSIAEKFLTNYKQVNGIRNMLAFTGDYNGKRVTIFGSGMGMPSIGIYSYELFNFYDVQRIIRIGSAGAYVDSLNLYDVVLASSAYSESSYAKVFCNNKKDTTYPSPKLNEDIIAKAKEIDQKITLGTIHSSDVFYHSDTDYFKKIAKKYKAICVEMESNALFVNASKLGKEASCLLTISDSLVKKTATTAEERQNNFMAMVKLALEAI